MSSKNQYKRKNVKSKKSQRVHASWDGQGTINNTQQSIPRSVGLVISDRYRTGLRYWKMVSFNLAAVNTAAVRFSPSNAYDVDPLVGGTNMSGFIEMAGFYNRYRVLASKLKCEVTNGTNATPIVVITCPLNDDPGSTPTSAAILSWKEQPYAVSKMVGLTGSPVIVIDNRMSTEKIFGSKMALFDDAFQAYTTNSPGNNWFWAIGVYSLATTSANIQICVTIEVDVEFFDRRVVFQ